MALTKVQAEGVNLADTFAFTGTVSGTGGMDLILSATISSAVANYDISSTYINSTYDTYKLIATLVPATDSVTLQSQVFVDGSRDNGTNYGSEVGTFDGGSLDTSDSQNHMDFVIYNLGSDTGEGVSLIGTLTNINATNLPFSFVGTTHSGATSAVPISAIFFNGHKMDQASSVVNGLRLEFSSGNIESGSIQLYGIRK
jgi:hypothetical protein